MLKVFAKRIFPYYENNKNNHNKKDMLDVLYLASVTLRNIVQQQQSSQCFEPVAVFKLTRIQVLSLYSLGVKNLKRIFCSTIARCEDVIQEK